MAAFFGERSVVEGIACQSKTEASIVSNFLRFGFRPTKPSSVVTDHGRYTPDFEFEDFFVEVKSPGTWSVCCGEEAFFEGASDDRLGKRNNKQLLKILWTNSKVKPVVVVVLKRQTSKKKAAATLIKDLQVIDIDSLLLNQPSFNLYDIIQRRLSLA